MKHSPRALTSLIKTAACAVLMVGMAAHAQVNPTGTWTWTQPGRGGGPDRTNSVTLKFADGKLTGSYMAPGRGGAAGTPMDISNGKVDGDNISFEVVRENPNGGPSNTNKFYGKISGDTITGKTEGGFGGGRRGGGGGGAGGAPGGGAPGGGAPGAGGPPPARDWTATKSK
jgi:hypothetical protein